MFNARSRRRLLPVAVAAFAMLAGPVPPGAAAAGTPTASRSAVTAAPTALPPTAGLGTSLLNSSVGFQLSLTSMPKGKRSVKVEVRTRQRGKARYIARMYIYKSGKVKIKYYARSTKGRTKKVGKTATLFRGVRPGVAYTVQTSTRSQAGSVLLATRMWPSSGPASEAWVSRTDRKSSRLTNAGTARIKAKRSKKARPQISAVNVVDLDTVTGSATPGGGTPAPPPPPPTSPPPPPPPVIGGDGSTGSRIVGSAGAAYTGPAPTVPPHSLPAVVPDSSISIPASPPGDGTYIFVSPNGSDSRSGTSRQQAVRTLPRAVSLARSGGVIVMLAGTYPANPNTVFVTKSNVLITADTGARVVIDGTTALDPSSRRDQGGLATFPYTQVKADIGDGHDLLLLPPGVDNGVVTALAQDRGWACVSGDGQSYSSHGTPSPGNPGGCPSGTHPRVITGYYPDQVWSGNRRLIQVGELSKVRPGRFYVDRSFATDRSVRGTTLYLDPSDAADVRVSTPVGSSDPRGAASLLEAKASGVRFNGIHIHGFAGPWWSYPVHVYGAQAGFSATNMLITDNSGIAVKVTGLPTPGGAGLGYNVTVRDVRVHRPGWASVVVAYATGVTVDRVESVSGNPDGERVEVSQIRVVKTHETRLTNSVVRDAVGHGVWFDQSCYNSDIVGNRFQGNSMSQLFYEFSHAGTIVGNVLIGNPADPPLRLSGASATRLVNNTIIGGTEPIWIYTDPRAKFFPDPATGAPRSCADHPIRYGQADAAAAARDCNITTVSDYDYARPGAFAPGGQPNHTPGMTWRVSIALMVNNVLGPPTGRNHCGLPGDPPVVFCIGAFTDFAGIVNEIPLNEILPSGAIIDGNVYQSGGGLVHAWGGPGRPGSFATADMATLQAALAGPYYRMAAPEHHAQSGTGWTDGAGLPTPQLNSVHAWAAPVPPDARVNAHVPAGARHYGAFFG